MLHNCEAIVTFSLLVRFVKIYHKFHLPNPLLCDNLQFVILVFINCS